MAYLFHSSKILKQYSLVVDEPFLSFSDISVSTEMKSFAQIQ